MAIWKRLKNSGYRVRVYLFAGLMVFLVVTSLAFTSGFSLYAKQRFAVIKEKDLQARKTERTLFELAVSMESNRKMYFVLSDLNRKKYFFLIKADHYVRAFEEDARSFRKQLSTLEELGLSELEESIFLEIKERFEDFLREDPFAAAEDPSDIESVSSLHLEEIQHKLQDLRDLNEKKVELRITEMKQLAQSILEAVLLGAPFSLFAAGLLSFLLIRSITGPIELLRRGTHAIAEGKFLHRVELATRDELGELAEAFNQMAYQLKRLDDLKAEFIALVSHELKTPLTSMKEAVGLLLEGAVGPISPKQERLLLINAAGIDKLTGFVEDILNITRMEGGLAPLYSTRFDLQRLLREELDTFRLLADKKRIRLSAVCRPDPLPLAFGDAERMRQVLANLLSNAILYTPDGGEVSLEVECIPTRFLPSRLKEDSKLESAKHWLKIKISDTGEGMPREEWHRVFDKFYQIQKDSNRSSGSGLGLSIAKQIVEAHGGTIWVEDSSEKGTTFIFVVPQDEAAKEKVVREEATMGRLQLQNPYGGGL